MDSFCLLGPYEILLQACFLANHPFLHKIKADLTPLIIQRFKREAGF